MKSLRGEIDSDSMSSIALLPDDDSSSTECQGLRCKC